MTVIQKVEAPIQGLSQTVTDTKFAAAIITSGAPLHKMHIVYDEKNPKSSGGEGHFLFGSNAESPLTELKKIWDKETADGELETFISEAKQDASKLAFLVELESKLDDAILIWQKKAINNFQRLGKFFRDEAEEFILIDGQVIYHGKKGQSK